MTDPGADLPCIDASSDLIRETRGGTWPTGGGPRKRARTPRASRE
jgi:hypothetical protein